MANKVMDYAWVLAILCSTGTLVSVSLGLNFLAVIFGVLFVVALWATLWPPIRDFFEEPK
jgi:hypothetical protein